MATAEEKYSFYSKWEKEKQRKKLIKSFKKSLKEKKDPIIEKELKAVGELREEVLGINWLGVEEFLRGCGLLKCQNNMGWIITNVCKPLCEDEECELIELFYGIKVDGASCVGKANWFFSYTWAEPFQSTMQSLRSNLFSRNMDEDPLAERYYWWDLFCQNQHHVNDVQETFDTAINQVSSLALSIPNPGEPIAITRIWCLFEVMSAISNDKLVQVYCNFASSSSAAASNIPEIDARNANATVEADKQMIFGLIEERVKGGIDELNKETFKAIRDGLVQAIIVRDATKKQKRIGELEVEDEDEDKYEYLNFRELKKLVMRSEIADKVKVKQMIKREQIIKYALENDIGLPSEEEVEKLKAEAQERARKEDEAEARIGHLAHAKGMAVRSADWI